MDAAISSICLAPSHVVRHGVRLIVVTVDYCLWDIQIAKRSRPDGPITVNGVDQSSYLGCQPSVEFAIVSDMGVHLHGVFSRSYRLGPDRQADANRFQLEASSRSDRTAICIVLTSGPDQAISSSSSGSASLSVDHRFHSLITGRHDGSPTIICAQANGSVTWAKPDQTTPSSLVIDMEEPVVSCHVVRLEALSGLVFISSSGKVAWLSIDGARQWHRLYTHVQSTAIVNGSWLYFLSDHSLYVVDLIEAFSSADARSTSSRQCRPMVYRLSSLSRNTSLSQICSNLSDDAVLTAISCSKSILYLDTRDDCPTDPICDSSLSSALNTIDCFSAASAAVEERSASLDRSLHAAHIALLLTNPPNSGSQLLCSVQSRPSYQTCSPAIVFDIHIVNNLPLPIPAPFFVLFVEIVESTESGSCFKGFNIPFKAIGPGSSADYSVVSSLGSDLPLQVRVLLSYMSLASLPATNLPAPTRNIELFSGDIGPIHLSQISGSGSLDFSGSRSSKPWIAEWFNLGSYGKSIAPLSCTINVYRPDVSHETAIMILKHIVAPSSMKVEDLGKTSCQLMVNDENRAQITTTANIQSSTITIFLQCSHSSLLPIWRSAVVERLKSIPQYPSDAVSLWKSQVAQTIFPNLLTAMCELRSCSVDFLGGMAVGDNHDMSKVLISSLDHARWAQDQISKLLSTYQSFRKIAQELPM